jgi:hypothetical protein
LIHPDLVHDTPYEGHLLIAVGRNHALLKAKKFSLSELSNFPATLHKSAPGIDICETHPNFEKYGIVPSITAQFDDDDLAIENLRASHSWSLLPDIVITKSKDLVAVPHPKDWRAPYKIVFSRRTRMKENVVAGLVRENLQLLLRKSRS